MLAKHAIRSAEHDKIRQMRKERIGGFGGTSDILASNQIYGGSPDYYKTALKYVTEANIEDIRKTCRDCNWRNRWADLYREPWKRI